MSGFVVMARDATEHPLLRDGERFRAWFWMVAKACWKPTKFDVHGKVVTLERGQFCVSVREMAEAWGWSKSAVDRFIQRLIDEDMVISTRAKTGTGSGTATGTARSIITICNYAKYQDIPKANGTTSEPPSGTAAGQQRDIKEQGNHSDVLEPDGSKHQRARARTPPVPRPDDVDQQTWTDFNRQRRKPLTVTALRAIKLEADKAGWTLEQALTECAARGWEGFKAKWIEDKRHDRQRSPAPTNGIAAALDRRIELGGPPGPVGRYDADGARDDRAITVAPVALLR